MSLQYPLSKSTTLGRSSNCDIQVSSQFAKVSRQHAQIRQHSSGMFVLYDQSSAGTFVNGRPEKQIVLKNGDCISLGGVIELVYANGVLTAPPSGIHARNHPIAYANYAAPSPPIQVAIVNPVSPADRPWQETGMDVGIASLIFGGLTFGIQLAGGLICGWVGWVLGIVAIVTGIMAITKGAKLFGIGGILLSTVGAIYQVLSLMEYLF